MDTVSYLYGCLAVALLGEGSERRPLLMHGPYFKAFELFSWSTLRCREGCLASGFAMRHLTKPLASAALKPGRADTGFQVRKIADEAGKNYATSGMMVKSLDQKKEVRYFKI